MALGQERCSLTAGLHGKESVFLREPLANVVGDLVIAEAAEPVPGKHPVIEPRLIVANQPGRDQDGGQRVLSAEPLDDRSHVSPARSVGEFIQPVEDHQRCPGKKKPLNATGRCRALIEGLQLVLEMASD